MEDIVYWTEYDKGEGIAGVSTGAEHADVQKAKAIMSAWFSNFAKEYGLINACLDLENGKAFLEWNHKTVIIGITKVE